MKKSPSETNYFCVLSDPVESRFYLNTCVVSVDNVDPIITRFPLMLQPWWTAALFVIQPTNCMLTVLYHMGNHNYTDSEFTQRLHRLGLNCFNETVLSADPD